MAANLDNINITISANTKDATKNVENLTKALDGLKGALSGIDTTALENIANSMGNLGEAAKTIKNSDVSKTMKEFAKFNDAVSGTSDALGKTTDGFGDFARATKTAQEATKGMATEIGGSGQSGVQKFGETLKNVSNDAKTALKGFWSFGQKVASTFKKIIPSANKSSSAIRKTGKSTSLASVSAKKLAKELLRVGKMMKLMITRMILRKIITGVAEGFKNLAQYSGQVNASMSLLWNSFRQLGNSIAAAVSPLLNALAPALNYIIQLAVQAANAINQLISALMGLGTWTKAKTLTDSYADSLKKAGGAAKELKKTVLGFDELNQLQDNKSSGGGTTDPSNMFETANVEDKWKDIADKIKKYWEKLVNPIKRAWARAGEYVKKSWEKAFESVKNLTLDIVDDFLEVWNQPRTVQMLEDMMRIVGNIGQFVGNLADSFDRAWNKADVGKRIFEDVRNICADIVGVIEDITLSWALWADKVNFTPLLEGLDAWLSSLEKPINAIMGVISDLNENFIQPVTKWIVEVGAPELLDVFTQFNEKVDWDLLRERLDRVWSALSHFTTEVGQGLIQFIGDISDELADGINSDAFGKLVDVLVDFMNNVKAEDIEDGLKVILGAIVAYKTLTWLSACTSALKAFFALFAAEGAGTMAAGNMATTANSVSALGTALASLGLTGHFIEGISNLKSVWEQRHAMDDYVITMDEVQEAQNDFVNSFGKDMQMVKDSHYGLSDATTKSAAQIRESLARTKTSFVGDTAAISKSVGDTTKSVSTNIKDLSTTAHTETANMKQYYSDANVAISGEFKTLEKNEQSLIDTIKKSFDKSNWTFSGVADGLKETFESAKNAIKGVWNSIADSLNGSHSIGGGSFRINLPKLYATGGFPEDGLFMANHNELVGKFSNGKTAVANNEQITNGIAQAVYSAITAANSGSSGQYINNTIMVDGVAIARAVTKGQERLDRRYSPTMA